MADLVDRLLAKAHLAVDAAISRLAGATEAAAKRASGASKSLKHASSRTKERAATAAGEDSGAWDAGAAAAARHYERRASMEALLLCVVAGFFLRILYMNTGFVLQALSPAKYAFADPGAAPLAVWEWLFGTGPRAARAAGGQMIPLPPIRGVVPRLLSAMLAALPSVEHSVVMVRAQPLARSQPPPPSAGDATPRRMPEQWCCAHIAASRSAPTRAPLCHRQPRNSVLQSCAPGLTHAPLHRTDVDSGGWLRCVSLRLRRADGGVWAARGGDDPRGGAQARRCVQGCAQGRRRQVEGSSAKQRLLYATQPMMARHAVSSCTHGLRLLRKRCVQR